MKPDLVFFGESVPRERVERVKRELAKCDALLVLGSSLYVYSGYRLAQVVLACVVPGSNLNFGILPHYSSHSLKKVNKFKSGIEVIIRGS